MISTEIRFASPHSTTFGSHLRPGQKSITTPTKLNSSISKSQRSASFGSIQAVDKEGMSMAGTEDLQERKRRFDLEFGQDRTRITSNSPPLKMYSRNSLENNAGGAMEASASIRRNGHSSPKGHYSQSYGSSMHDEEDAITKRRRIEVDEMNYTVAPEEEEEYRRARMHGGGYGGTEERYGGHHPADHHHHRRSIGEDSMDPTVPLARRRGDAAQAKASRLHIDTGFGGQEHHDLFGRSSLSASQPASHAIKSAPPSKVSFSERDDIDFDPRREAFTRAHGLGPSGNSGAQRRAGEGQMADNIAGGPYNRRLEGLEGSSYANEGSNSVASNRRDHVHYSGIPPHAGGGGNGNSFRPGMAPSNTPLTASRAFVPQTATLPSPAYHTTKFIGQAGGAAVAAHANTHSNAIPSTQSNAREQVPPGPRTAGFNPPATARLPDHLRSPPSNKTQFLSLFSNFYDSLQDSRTLKATLEDQVRRSNTLLQTLQRSARVLELTVERRLNSERANWEQKIQALEERCRRLEGKTGAGSPTPTKETIGAEIGASNGRGSTELENGENGNKAQDVTGSLIDSEKVTEETKSKETKASD